jgi:hypothetical protein
MTYPRVNLLKKNEQRYQGAVSSRVIYMGIIAVPILVVAILGGVTLIQHRRVQSNLKESRATWTDTEPRLKRFEADHKRLTDNRQALELLEGWRSSRTPIAGLLSDLQDTVSPNIQIIRLSIQTVGAARSAKTAGELDTSYKLLVEGLSQGDLAEDEVIRLRKDLLASREISSVFESINLASMRKRKGQGGSSIREFKLEGASAEGGVK